MGEGRHSLSSHSDKVQGAEGHGQAVNVWLKVADRSCSGKDTAGAAKDWFSGALLRV